MRIPVGPRLATTITHVRIMAGGIRAHSCGSLVQLLPSLSTALGIPKVHLLLRCHRLLFLPPFAAPL